MKTFYLTQAEAKFLQKLAADGDRDYGAMLDFRDLAAYLHGPGSDAEKHKTLALILS